MTVGRYGVLGPQQARDKARHLLARVKLEDADPLAERRSQSTAQTVADLAERYMSEYVVVRKKPTSIQGDRQMIQAYVLPQLGRLRISEVSRADLARLHHSLRATPYAANRVLALLSKMFNLAEKWDLRPDHSNPCRHVERFKEAKRERYLSAAEFSQLADTLAEAESDGTESPHVIAAVRLLMLTGCRLREILHLRWDDVDLENGRLNLPDSKTGAKTVYLSATARQILAEIPRTADYPWVIEGRKSTAPRSDLNGPWRRIRARAGLEDVRLHDLRHSFAAMGAGLGLSLPIIGKLLGHSRPETTARYAHLAADPMHKAADKVGAAIETAMMGLVPS
jgi:integrase